MSIEIPDRVFANPGDALLDTLNSLVELGLTISVDDFGSGFGSLVYLQQLPISQTKLDRRLIAGLLDGDRQRAIVRSTIELAHELGLRVVAEGVESAHHLEVLTGLGCDLAQGYAIARPADPAELGDLGAISIPIRPSGCSDPRPTESRPRRA